MRGSRLEHCTVVVAAAEPAAAVACHTYTLAARVADDRRCPVKQPDQVAVEAVDTNSEGSEEFADSVTSPREVFAVLDHRGRLSSWLDWVLPPVVAAELVAVRVALAGHTVRIGELRKQG